MKNNKGISLISVIIAILLIAILVVLIWVGIAVMNSVEEDSKKEENNSKIAVNNDKDKGKSSSSIDLDDLVYDAEFDYKTGINGFTYTTNEWGSEVETTHTYVKNSTEIEGFDLKTSSFPYVNIDSDYAEEINNNVENLYESYLDDFKERITVIRDTNDIEDLKEREYARYQGDYITVENDIVNYEAYLNGDILSIVIIEGPFTNVGYEYTVYNIDVVTGKEVSYQDIISKSKYSDYSKLKNAISQKAEEILIEVYSDPKITELGKERFEENMDITLNKYIFKNSGSLNAYGAYFNDESNLCLILATHTGMGTSTQQFIYELE